MIVTIEISYYPLTDDFNSPIQLFLNKLQREEIEVEVGTMSTLITGEFEKVMEILQNSMGDVMEKYPSVFNMKISNSCIVK